MEGKFGSTTCGSKGDGTMWVKEAEKTQKIGRRKFRWDQIKEKKCNERMNEKDVKKE